jgi:hypothetical protein
MSDPLAPIEEKLPPIETCKDAFAHVIEFFGNLLASHPCKSFEFKPNMSKDGEGSFVLTCVIPAREKVQK